MSLAQDLFQVLTVRRRASAADHRLRQAAADALTTVLDVVVEVQERYAAAQSHEALLPVLLERRELLDKLVAVARARLQAQEGTRSDLSTLQAQGVELDVDIAEARRALREDRLRLARLIGEPSGTASWRLDAWDRPAISTNDESRWIEAALAHRPEAQSAAWRLAALGDDRAIAALSPWESAGAGAAAERDDDWTVGPSVSTPLPVFDTGQARRARITAEQVEARHELTLANRRIVEEVRIALQSLIAQEGNLHRIESELIPLQQQRRQQAEDAYRAGVTDVTALFLAEHDLREAQSKTLEVEHQISVSLARLQRAAGGPGPAAAVTSASLSQPMPRTHTNEPSSGTLK